MKLEATKVTTHETVYSGTIGHEQLVEILIPALRDALNAPYNGLRLEIIRVTPAAEGDPHQLPTIDYDLVADHDWYMRSPSARL